MYEASTFYQEQMASPNTTLSVVDVYDIAASIGKEFEALIDNCGPEAVTDLMPKVILVLEQLEILASKNQKENAEISELKLVIERLEAEKSAKATQRLKYEKELEELEESWRKETSELLDTVTKLQDDNRRLRSSLAEIEGQSSELTKDQEDDMKLMTKLRENSDKQRDQIRNLQRELSQKNGDIEAMNESVMDLENKLGHVTKEHNLLAIEKIFDLQSMQSQVERLAKLNTDYRRKNMLNQRQAQHLIQEKAELQAQLHGKEQQITQIKGVIRNQESLDGVPSSPISEEDYDRLEEHLSLEGKMVIDMKDPDRPRFTLNELRGVLQERNELKTKLIELEEELQQYKPKVEEIIEDSDSSTSSSEEAPVQGPINREPWEKLYPNRKPDSQIRRFFKFFFGEGEKSGQKGRRGSRPRKQVPPKQQ